MNGRPRSRVRALGVLGVLCVCAVASLALAQDVAGERPDCAHASTQSVMTAFGFDHVVRIENACPAALRCTSSTSSAPEPVQSVTQPAARTELVLFRGSPASVFRASVDCSTR